MNTDADNINLNPNPDEGSNSSASQNPENVSSSDSATEASAEQETPSAESSASSDTSSEKSSKPTDDSSDNTDASEEPSDNESESKSSLASIGKQVANYWLLMRPFFKLMGKGLKVVWKFVKASWRWLTPLLIVVVILLSMMSRGQGLFHNMRNPFRTEPIVIDQTLNVVTTIRSLAEYTSVKYVVELPIVKSKAHKEIVLLARGTVRAGFDLSWVDTSCVSVNPQTQTLTLRIPPARIHEVICSPGDFQIFHSTGSWSTTEITNVKRQARIEIEKRAVEDRILERAEKIGLVRLEEILMSFGFEHVVIEPNLDVPQ